MRKWDGRYIDRFTGAARQYPQDEIEMWDIQIDKEGNIWYRSREKNRPLYIWCANYKLADHLYELDKIKNRE